MREAVIVASSRTPLAKSFRGSFNLTRPDDLAAHCIKDALGKVPRLDPKEVEDVIPGCGQPHGAQGTTSPGGRPAGRARLVGGGHDGEPVLLVGAPGHRHGRASHHERRRGGRDRGRVESITMLKRDSDPNPWVKEHWPGTYMVMGDTAEVVAKRYKISREAQDQYSLESQKRTARAQREGFFKEELAPMQVVRGRARQRRRARW